MSSDAVACRVFDTGHCLATEAHVIRGGRWSRIECHNLVAALYHPVRGWGLFDAGYSRHLFDATARLPWRVYRWATPLRLDRSLEAVVQLAAMGVKPDEVRWIVVSHFHADHVAGLRDFPMAELFAAEAAIADVTSRRGLSALQRGYMPALLPDDFASRVRPIEAIAGPELGPLGRGHDLFGDERFVAVALPGHARGQIGLLAQTDRGERLFVADACWQSRGIREQRVPHPITHLFVDEPKVVRATLAHLKAFTDDRPEVVLVPTHCPEALTREVGP